MKIKKFRRRAVMDQEILFAEKWLKDAQECLAIAEDNLHEVRAMVFENKKPSRELLAFLKESAQLVREARDRVTFFDGVLVGMIQLRKAVEAHSAEEIENPFIYFKK